MKKPLVLVIAAMLGVGLLTVLGIGTYSLLRSDSEPASKNSPQASAQTTSTQAFSQIAPGVPSDGIDTVAPETPPAPVSTELPATLQPTSIPESELSDAPAAVQAPATTRASDQVTVTATVSIPAVKPVTPGPPTATPSPVIPVNPQLSPMQRCQAALKLRPSYAPNQSKWTITCVNRLTKGRLATDPSSGVAVTGPIYILVRPNFSIEQYHVVIAHAWAHAEAASWGQKGYEYNTQWMRIIGHKPLQHSEYWAAKAGTASPANAWANARAKCALGEGFNQSMYRQASCDQVNQLVHYINQHN